MNAGHSIGVITLLTSGIPSSFLISAVDCFGNSLRGVVMIHTFESSNPSFNKMTNAQFQDSTDDIALMQSITLSSDDITAPVTLTLRSSRSRRLLIQSWFLNGPQGLSSTYYADCSWTVPFESLLTSIPSFRPIGSAAMNDKGLQFVSMTHPCSVQWSGLLRISNVSQGASVSFELGCSRGSCLTLFINGIICCSTCHSFGFHHHKYGRSLNHKTCKCTSKVQGSANSDFWRLTLYGNSDGGSPNWDLKWFSENAHSDGFQPMQDSDVLPTSSIEHNITVFPGMQSA